MRIGHSAATIVSEVPAWKPWCNFFPPIILGVARIKPLR